MVPCRRANALRANHDPCFGRRRSNLSLAPWLCPWQASRIHQASQQSGATCTECCRLCASFCNSSALHHLDFRVLHDVRSDTNLRNACYMCLHICWPLPIRPRSDTSEGGGGESDLHPCCAILIDYHPNDLVKLSRDPPRTALLEAGAGLNHFQLQVF